MSAGPDAIRRRTGCPTARPTISSTTAACSWSGCTKRPADSGSRSVSHGASTSAGSAVPTASPRKGLRSRTAATSAGQAARNEAVVNSTDWDGGNDSRGAASGADGCASVRALVRRVGEAGSIEPRELPRGGSDGLIPPPPITCSRSTMRSSIAQRSSSVSTTSRGFPLRRTAVSLSASSLSMRSTSPAVNWLRYRSSVSRMASVRPSGSAPSWSMSKARSISPTPPMNSARSAPASMSCSTRGKTAAGRRSARRARTSA